MSLEEKLAGWTGPSSDTEQEKQERTERMVRSAIDEHAPFANCCLRVYAKGSYANNTNVRSDSDVDIAVECTEAVYWDEATPGLYTPAARYGGVWTPAKLRQELNAALASKFGNAVDASGSTAIRVHSGSARVDADVVPCFSYRYHLSPTESRPGTKIFKKDGNALVNYPEQQLLNGTNKNLRTGHAYKRAVRILKRAENAMVEAGAVSAMASYFIECLAYNCPDSIFSGATWTEIIRSMLIRIWNSLQGDEPQIPGQRWLQSSECLYLFDSTQTWARADGRSFSKAAWNYLGFS